MNGENNHIFHTSALDGVTLPSQARKSAGALIAAEAWLIAAFTALSLAAIGINALIASDGPLTPYIVLTAGGFTLFPVMLRKAAQALDRAEPDLEPAAPLAPELQFALHR
jgi:hypothetical protein